MAGSHVANGADTYRTCRIVRSGFNAVRGMIAQAVAGRITWQLIDDGRSRRVLADHLLKLIGAL